MEKKFDPEEWVKKCETCRYGKFVKFWECSLKFCDYKKKPPVTEIQVPKRTYNWKTDRLFARDLKEKVCPRCKLTKPIEEFPKHKTQSGNITYSYCRECERLNYRERQQRRKEKKRNENRFECT